MSGTTQPGEMLEKVTFFGKSEQARTGEKLPAPRLISTDHKLLPPAITF